MRISGNQKRRQSRGCLSNIVHLKGAVSTILMLLLLIVLVLFLAERSKSNLRNFIKLGSSIRPKQTSMLPAATSEIQHGDSSLSLWLLPPEPYRSELRKMIFEFSQKYPSSSAPFEPHVTVIGGMSCRNWEHAERIAQSLKEGLRRFGEVPCQFKKKPMRCKQVECTADENADDGKPYVWNQAFAMEMLDGDQFLNLIRLAREIIGMPLKTDISNIEYDFPKPLGRPHMSLFYGEQTVPSNDEVKPIPKFSATQLALWKTSPPTLEGVKDWKLVSVIDLVEA